MADIEIEKIRQRELHQSKKKPIKTKRSAIDFPEIGTKKPAIANEKGPRVRQDRKPMLSHIPRPSGQAPTQETGANNQEQNWSRDLAKDRLQHLNQQRSDNLSNKIVNDLNEPSLDLQNSEELSELQNAIKSKSQKKIQKAANKVMSKLSEGSACGGMVTFMVSVGLASIKDVIDLISTFISVGLIGSAINFIVTGALALILIIQGSSLKRAGVLKKYVKRYGITAIAEFIPIISFLPLWIIAVILARREAMKKRSSKQEAMLKLKNNLKKIGG